MSERYLCVRVCTCTCAHTRMYTRTDINSTISLRFFISQKTISITGFVCRRCRISSSPSVLLDVIAAAAVRRLGFECLADINVNQHFAVGTVRAPDDLSAELIFLFHLQHQIFILTTFLRSTLFYTRDHKNKAKTDFVVASHAVLCHSF